MAVLDDFSFGSLSDAERVGALRCRLWKSIWRTQWWITPDIEFKLSSEFCEYKNKLRQLAEENRPVVVWLGDNPYDRLMLAMICACLPDKTPLSVANVVTSPYLAGNKYTTVAMCSVALLQTVMPVKLSDRKRNFLKKLWLGWKSLGVGWRDINRYGCLVECPINYLDNDLLAELSTNTYKSAIAVFQRLMGRYFVSETFLYWRLSILKNNGFVFFTQDRNFVPIIIKLRVCGMDEGLLGGRALNLVHSLYNKVGCVSYSMKLWVFVFFKKRKPMNRITKLILIRNAMRFIFTLLNLFLMWFLFISPYVNDWIKPHAESSVYVAFIVATILCMFAAVNASIDKKIKVWQDASVRLKNLVDRVERDVVFYPARAEDCRFLEKNLESGNHYVAEFIAWKILIRQRKIVSGVPAHLLVYIQAIEEKSRTRCHNVEEVLAFKMSVANGDYEIAESQAIKILSSMR
ncbi:DUF1835 domain-containing protein [Enterobacter bugandensis]|uniref:DUF1835 domain-containing protein n=1 Tax=Enterobacter bugandensis TaxID=881260 RepID=UPI003BF89992|nr:DUF1835 domain-containing protein [Enterobacter bugandensis]